MHDCCEGKEDCNIECDKEIEMIIKQHNNPIIMCHHQKIVCRFQKTWYGPTKYCSCLTHEKLIDKK